MKHYVLTIDETLCSGPGIFSDADIAGVYEQYVSPGQRAVAHQVGNSYLVVKPRVQLIRLGKPDDKTNEPRMSKAVNPTPDYL